MKESLAFGAEASERLLRLVFEESREAVVALDAEGHILSWSRGAEALTGHAPLEVTGLALDRFCPQPVRAKFRELLSGTEPVVENLEWSFLAKSGAEVRVLLTVLRTTQAGKKGAETVLWFRPQPTAALGHLKEAGFKDTLFRLQQLSAVGQIAAALSHQIRTPLHVIQSTVEFIEDQLPPESPHLQGLRVVDRNIERIVGVADALRSLTRYKSHAYVVGDLNKVVEQVCLFMEMVCKKQGVVLKKSLGNVPPVRLDADYLLGALYNVMGNAVEAMPGGGVLTVTTAAREKEAVLTIVDTGVGIDPALLDRVGQPFLTTKETGTGLGLYVVREVLEQHHAKLQLESKKGVGTRVVVAFPEA